MSSNIIDKGDRKDNTARNRAIYHTIVIAFLFIGCIIGIYELINLFIWTEAHIDIIGLGIVAVVVAFGGAVAIMGVVILGIMLIDNIDMLIAKDY